MISLEEFERAASMVPTDLQYSLMEVIAAAGAASDGLLRRRSGLDTDRLRAQTDKLLDAGLIPPTESTGYLGRKLAAIRGESVWTMTAAAWENPNTPDTGPFTEAGEHTDEAVPRRYRPSRLRAKIVLVLGELRGWRLAHEPDRLNRCLCCGEVTILDEDERGRLWKVHEPTQRPIDAECLSASRLPSRLSRKIFGALRLSTPLRALEAATEGLRSGYCPQCGGSIDGFCFRHYADNGVGVVGYQ